MHARTNPLPWLAIVGALAAGCALNRSESTTPEGASSLTAAKPVSQSSLPSDIVGVTWQLVIFTSPVEQLKIDAPERYTVRFEPGGRLTVQADCNRGMSSYAVGDERRIVLQPIALTRMACSADSHSERFAKELSRAESYSQKDGDLVLQLPQDSGMMRFRRAPP